MPRSLPPSRASLPADRGTRPATRRSRLDFPAPLRPTTARVSPAATVKETFSKMMRPPRTQASLSARRRIGRRSDEPDAQKVVHMDDPDRPPALDREERHDLLQFHQLQGLA